MNTKCFKTTRIIPRLDVKGPNLVKGVHLEGLRVLGKPEEFAYKYYIDGADELIYIDVVASLYGRQNLIDIVKKMAGHIFIPLTAGGGIRSIDDIRNLLRAGADKVAINTAAVHNPKIISEGAKKFGSQCIIVAIAAQMADNGAYEVMTDNGRERTGKEVVKWAIEAANLGAGEILVTSIDREGTGNGYDLELIKKISDSVNIPVIACGGAARQEDFAEVILKADADAVCASSVFHYHRLEALKSADGFKGEGNTEFIRQNRGSVGYLNGKIHPQDIMSVKRFLQKSGICCRLFKDESIMSSAESV